MSEPSEHRWLSGVAPCPSIQPTWFPAKSLCGSMATSPGWVEPNRVIYDHELVLILRGDYQIRVEGTTYLCPQNTYIIIPPDHWHMSTCLRKGRRFYAHFDWQYESVPSDCPVMTFHPARPKRDMLRMAPSIVPTGVLQGEIQSPAVAFDLAERLRLMLSSGNPHERLASRGVLLELLIRLLDPQPRQNAPQHRSEELAHQVRKVLDTSMSKSDSSVTIRPLLTAMGHSYEHLARVFRQQYGLTPMDYVQSIRMERAKHLLRQTNMKIAAVAAAVGYQDGIYFSRLFKRHSGLSPGRFRHD